MPVLIAALPSLTDPQLVGAVAGHLRRPWARPAAFAALLSAFETWASRDDLGAGWHLGDALGSAATIAEAPILLRLSQHIGYGKARQMVVASLGRFKANPDVEAVLLGLLDDPDVALHAMSALRRVADPAEALRHFERVEREHRGRPIGAVAAREMKKVRKVLRSS